MSKLSATMVDVIYLSTMVDVIYLSTMVDVMYLSTMVDGVVCLIASVVENKESPERFRKSREREEGERHAFRRPSACFIMYVRFFTFALRLLNFTMS